MKTIYLILALSLMVISCNETLTDSEKQSCKLIIKVFGKNDVPALNAKVTIRTSDSTFVYDSTISSGELSASLLEGKYIISAKTGDSIVVYTNVKYILMPGGLEREIELRPFTENNGGTARFFIHDSTNKPIADMNVVLLCSFDIFGDANLPFSYYKSYAFLNRRTDMAGKITFNDIPRQYRYSLLIFRNEMSYTYYKNQFDGNNNGEYYYPVLFSE